MNKVLARIYAAGGAIKHFFAQSAAGEHDARSEIRIGGAAFLAFFVFFLGWAAVAPLDAAVVAPAVVTVSGERQTVQHRDGGVVSRLAVVEGQTVKQGDILLELAAIEMQAQERALFSQSVELGAQHARLVAEAAGQNKITPPPEWAAMTPDENAAAMAALERHRRELAARGAALSSDRGVLSQREGQLGARIQGHHDEIAAVERRQKLKADELAGLQTLLEKGLVPMTRVRAVESDIAELDGRKAELLSAIAQAQQGIGETRMQSTGVENTRRKEDAEELRQVSLRLAEVAPQLAAVRQQLERTRLRAPMSGKVVGLSVHTVGGVVRPGERLMDIVPDGKALVVQARVRPEDADDIRIGQNAEIRVTAFSGRSMPILHGVIRAVSADRLVEEHTGAAYFLAEVEAPADKLWTGGQLRMSAGLPAEMVAVTRKRTALDYLLEPLNQAMWRSFREQ